MSPYYAEQAILFYKISLIYMPIYIKTPGVYEIPQLMACGAVVRTVAGVVWHSSLACPARRMYGKGHRCINVVWKKVSHKRCFS